MNFIKRNKILVALVSAALIAAIILGVLLFKSSADAAELKDKVQQQKQFFNKIKRQEIAVTTKNRKLLEDNVAKTKEQLKQLRTRLWQKTHINTRSLNSIETINILGEEVINMRNNLKKSGISVAESASGFSFSNILQRDTPPDEETEVPIILKQLKIINEIVNILSQHYIDSVQNIERPLGLNVDVRNFFDIIPIALTITGDTKSIRQVVTSLQKDSDYIFFIEQINFTTPNKAQTLMEQRGNMTENYRGRRDSTRPDSRRFASPEMMEERGGESGSEEQSEKLPKKARTIPIQKRATCNIQLTFLEFHNPDKSSTEKKD